MQGRNLHWLGPNPAASHHDNLFRDLGSPSSNPDVADLDHLVDTLVAAGVDRPARVYIMGWSNGAFFSQLYAIARYAAATRSQHHVAAAVAYAGADPFSDPTGAPIRAASSPRTPLGRLRIYAIHRACDAFVPCDLPQAMQRSASVPVAPWSRRPARSSR